MSNAILNFEGKPVPPTLGVYQSAVSPVGLNPSGGGRGLKAKTLKRMLKKAGLKVSGKKATLRSRAKKARLIRGGVQAGLEQIEGAEEAAPVTGGRRSRRRRSLFRKFW